MFLPNVEIQKTLIPIVNLYIEMDIYTHPKLVHND